LSGVSSTFRISFLNICWRGELRKSVGRLFPSLIVLGGKKNFDIN
jgi:hypothetical protein